MSLHASTDSEPPLGASRAGGVTVARLAGPELRAESAAALGAALAKLAAGPGPRLVVNVEGVTRMDSAVLAQLLVLHANVAEAGGRLVVCGAAADVRRVLRVTRLDTVLRLVDTEAAAIDEAAGAVTGTRRAFSTPRAARAGLAAGAAVAGLAATAALVRATFDRAGPSRWGLVALGAGVVAAALGGASGLVRPGRGPGHTSPHLGAVRPEPPDHEPTGEFPA